MPKRDKWETERREKDFEEIGNAEYYQEGEIVYQNITDLISRYPTPGSKMLDKALSREISKYGADNVINAMGQAPEDVVGLAQSIVYYEDSADGIHAALVEFFEIITGTITSAEEAKMLGETMDELTDFDVP